jgi:hypothetical protein
MLDIEVELEYISVARSLSGCGPKGEPNAPITAESEVTNFLRRETLLLLLFRPAMKC